MSPEAVVTNSGPGKAYPPLPFAQHFASWGVQNEAARLGMWMFLGTEVLLFAGLFACYAAYRFLFPETWAAASDRLDLTMGGVNTVVLITSSLTVALAVDATKRGGNKKAFWLLVFTLACAAAFLVVKAFEYSHKIHDGLLPGIYFTNPEFRPPGVTLFYTVYFLSTGLHALHVVIGASILVYCAVRCWKGHFHADNYVAMELGGLYWHLVDLVWIFLFPLLYLV